MLFLMSVDLRPGAEKEFQEWAVKNKGQLAKNLPPHWKLWGIYGATFGLGRHDVTVIYEFGEWADFDAMREYSNKLSDRLDAEFSSFMRDSSVHSMVLREVTEWRVAEPKKPEM